MRTNVADIGGDKIPAVAERRGEFRRKVDIAARVRVLNPLLSTGAAALAHVHNRSARGMKITVPRQVFIGALVQVLLPGEIILGEVRYCSPAGDQFDIGITIVESLTRRS